MTKGELLNVQEYIVSKAEYLKKTNKPTANLEAKLERLRTCYKIIRERVNRYPELENLESMKEP